MQVNVIGRHLTITPEIEAHAEERLSKLDRYFAGVRKVDLVLALEGHGQAKLCMAEATVVLAPGTHLVGKGEAADMLAAIDIAESRLAKQIRRFHARLKSHRDRTRISAGDTSAAASGREEETYEQVVREMLEGEEE